MEIDKRTFLVTGTKNVKTKEKIRLKLRLALNTYKKCLIGVIPMQDLSRKAFYFGKDGYKHLMLIYKSASKSNVFHFQEVFKEMYRNEISVISDEEENLEEKSGQHVLFLLGKTKKIRF